MDTIIDSIGLVSSILIAVMFVPQIVHVYRTKDTDAINYTFLGLNVFGKFIGSRVLNLFQCSAYDCCQYECWSVLNFSHMYETRQ